MAGLRDCVIRTVVKGVFLEKISISVVKKHKFI